jgi:rsbT co-antagonist protein RsbR
LQLRVCRRFMPPMPWGMDMIRNENSRISEVLKAHAGDLLADWLRAQKAALTRRQDLMKDDELREQSTEFLRLLADAAHDGDITDIAGASWAKVRDMLAGLSEARARKGFSPSETATFVFSLKQPLFTQLRDTLTKEPQAFAEEAWAATVLLDQLGLFTTEVYQKGREAVIARQQQELLELSTPVIQLWDGILAVPLIGTLDSARTQTIMESLLERIVETRSGIAIIDITGVPTVDTLVAQHLLKTVAAARLMGADCIISGIRPQIAQTIVHLGVALGDVITKASLADALALALSRRGLAVARAQARVA